MARNPKRRDADAAYQAGWVAAALQKPQAANPYSPARPDRWRRGWLDFWQAVESGSLRRPVGPDAGGVTPVGGEGGHPPFACVVRG